MKIKTILRVVTVNWLTRMYNLVKSMIENGSFDESGFGSADSYLEEAMPSVSMKISQQTYRSTLTRLKLREVPKTLSPNAKTYLNEKALIRLKSIQGTLKDELKVKFLEVINSGKTIPEQQAILKEYLRGKASSGKIDVIVDTEYGVAYNGGINEALEVVKGEGKRIFKTWRTTGANIRESHEDLEGETIEQGEQFSNGLECPMDPAGPPEEVINCKCYMDIELKNEDED